MNSNYDLKAVPTGPSGLTHALANNRELAERRWGEGSVLDATIGTPQGPMPAEMILAFGHPDNNYGGYPPAAGSDTLQDAMRSWLSSTYPQLMNRTASLVVRPTPGIKSEVALVFQTLRMARPSATKVLLPETCYPTYRYGARYAGLEEVNVPFTEDGQMDLEFAGEHASDAICIVVNSPHNPTGSVQRLDELAKWAADQDIVVISDEAYWAFDWTHLDTVADTMMAYADVCQAISLYSFSKSHMAAGLRSGFMACSHNLGHFMTKWDRELGQQANIGGQRALLCALTTNMGWDRSQIQRRYETAVQTLRDILSDTYPAASVPETRAGLYVWASTPARTGLEFSRMVAEEIGILGTPGIAYGLAGRWHVRFAAMHTAEEIQRIVGPPRYPRIN